MQDGAPRCVSRGEEDALPCRAPLLYAIVSLSDFSPGDRFAAVRSETEEVQGTASVPVGL